MFLYFILKKFVKIAFYIELLAQKWLKAKFKPSKIQLNLAKVSMIYYADFVLQYQSIADILNTVNILNTTRAYKYIVNEDSF